MFPTILTIAGSDSSGGAGIQADLAAIAANGGYGASVLTAITAQNTRGVRRAEPLAPDLIRAQMDAVFEDLEVAAVKTGMLANGAIIRAVAEGLRHWKPRAYVCDPVMVAKSGAALLEPGAVETLKRELLPLATVVTPNSREAEVLTGLPVRDLAGAEAAGRRLLELGPRAVLVKGGHLDGPQATDVLVAEGVSRRYEAERLDRRHTHGTGCAYSAAIATGLARGLELEEAVALAKEFITEAIRHGLPVGGGVGPAHPFFFLRGPEQAARWLERLARRGVPS